MISGTQRTPPVRFAFGKNWRRFLALLSEERIVEAERSLRSMLGPEPVSGRRFLDVGSGSGIFSLAAARLGATRIHSFDLDPDSVECTRALKDLYFPHMGGWTVGQGSILDLGYLRDLGAWDVVYAWGVLHHTGSMWQALDNVTHLVAAAGILFLSIYNDQGGRSRRWKRMKLLFSTSRLARLLISSIVIPKWVAWDLLVDLKNGSNPLRRYREYKRSRGMSKWHDWIDWLGGFPFEVARPDEIFRFFRDRGFVLHELRTVGGGLACNEFVFHRAHQPPPTCR